MDLQLGGRVAVVTIAARNRGPVELAAEDIAAAMGRSILPIAFLASPRVSFINGAHIPVDGAQRKAIMDS